MLRSRASIETSQAVGADALAVSVESVAVPAGGVRAWEAGAGRELVLVVVAGHARCSELDVAVRPGDFVLVPPGAGVRLAPDDTALRIVVFTASASVLSPGARGRVLASADTPALSLGADLGFRGVRSRLVVTHECGSQALLAGIAEFSPGGAHEMHRHRNAAEAYYLLEGAGVHRRTDGEEPVAVGELVLLDAGEWHSFHNPHAHTASIVFAYLGAASVETDGYELFAA